MKKRMMLVALLAIPFGQLLACHRCEEVKVRSNCNLCNMGCNSCKTRTYDRDSDILGYDAMDDSEIMYETPMGELLEVPYAQQVVEEQIGEEPMYEQQVVEEYMDVPFTRQNAQEMLEDQRGGYSTTPMYSQQVVEESLETGAVTGLTAQQRAQHSALMNDVKSTRGRKPSQVAGKKTTTPKKATTAKRTTTTKRTPAKKNTTAKTTSVKKTTNGKKVATNKTAKNKKAAKHAKNKAAKTNNVVA